MVETMGIEPTTSAMRMRRSTVELRPPVGGAGKDCTSPLKVSVERSSPRQINYTLEGDGLHRPRQVVEWIGGLAIAVHLEVKVSAGRSPGVTGETEHFTLTLEHNEIGFRTLPQEIRSEENQTQ